MLAPRLDVVGLHAQGTARQEETEVGSGDLEGDLLLLGGQALSGGATLSAGSWLVMFAIFGGAYGLAYFVRKLWN